MLCTLIDHLATEFSIKDLGDLHYFLGVEIIRNDKGFFLSHTNYALDLLTCAKMVDCKPISIHFVVSSHLLETGTTYSDATQYH